MTNDRERWDRKYLDRQVETSIQADPLLLQYAPRLSGPGRALDVAAGTCDNACLLAQLGYDSFAVDISVRGLGLCRQKAISNHLTVFTFVADLGIYPLPADAFDVISVMRFLDRALVPQLKASLRSGGWMFYRTFNQRKLLKNPSFSPAYVLTDGELQAMFADWEPVDSSDQEQYDDTVSHWVGRKP